MLVKVQPTDVDELGEFVFSVCFSCGNHRETFDVGALDSSLRACANCVLRYGREQLKGEAENALKWLLTPEGRRYATPDVIGAKCGHCGKPVEQDPVTREVPYVCAACFESMKRSFR